MSTALHAMTARDQMTLRMLSEDLKALGTPRIDDVSPKRRTSRIVVDKQLLHFPGSVVTVATRCGRVIDGFTGLLAMCVLSHAVYNDDSAAVIMSQLLMSPMTSNDLVYDSKK